MEPPRLFVFTTWSTEAERGLSFLAVRETQDELPARPLPGLLGFPDVLVVPGGGVICQAFGGNARRLVGRHRRGGPVTCHRHGHGITRADDAQAVVAPERELER